MSWNRQVNLVVDVDSVMANNAIRPHKGAGAPVALAGDLKVTLVAGDMVRFRLFFWSSVRAENLRLPDGLQLVICGKKDRSPEEALFFAMGHSEVNIGDEEEPVWAYDLLLDLNTVELAGAFGVDASLVARTDIELSSAGGVAPTTWRFHPTILRQVYEGGAPPTPSEPPYPPSALVLTSNLLVGAEIPQDAEQITLDISMLGLSAAPAAVLPVIRRPSAEAPRIMPVDFYAATAGQVTIGFSAAVPGPGYHISALVVR